MVTHTTAEASLTDVERVLVDHVTRGELLDLAADDSVDEAAMRSWSDGRTIRAAVLRDILRGRLAPDPDPQGLLLRGARIAGRLDLENLTTDVRMELRNCLLGEGLVARDAKLPVIVLSGCRLEHATEPPLDADRLRAAVLKLDGAVVTAACKTGAVRLPGGHLGTLECYGAMVRNATGPAFAGLLKGISSTGWLRLLREGTPSYAAQPYQQLAAAHHAAGQDGEARRTLMAQRQDQIDCGALTGRSERAWARLTGFLLGYGYQPWRTLLALLAVTVIAVALAVTLGVHGGVARTNPPPPAATECSAVERVGVGLDLGLPLIKTGARNHCDTTSSTTGQVLTVAGWVLQVLAWAFATLFVAGFTGAVRKT